MDREEYLELVKMNTGIEITSVESSLSKILIEWTEKNILNQLK